MEQTDIDVQFYLDDMKISRGSDTSRIAALSKMSCKMYEIMNFHIGSEKIVQKRRKIVNSRLKVFKCDEIPVRYMASGSKAEGLDMAGSDEDIMVCLDIFKVYTLDFPNIVPSNHEILLSANTVDDRVYPGFAILKAYDCRTKKYLGIWKSSDFVSKCAYPITSRFKIYTFQLHGPCVSRYGNETDIDIAMCLPCDEWPLVAEEWSIRNRNNDWPSSKLVQTITKEGCLFVPIGYEANNKFDRDWRISFSRAEKRLIFSFNHVQLLIYSLLKLFLKEVINTNCSIDGLLCSYFMKTILFWSIENTLSSLWVPNKFYASGYV